MSRNACAVAAGMIVLVLASNALQAGSAESVDELIDKLKEAPKSADVGQVVQKLGNLGSRAVEPLADCSGDTRAHVRLRAAEALSATGTVDALPHLVRALDDRNERVSRAAAGGIAAHGEEGLKAALPLLLEPDQVLRQKVRFELLPALREAFPVDTGTVESPGPLSARVDAGLVVGPRGPLSPPYRLQAARCPHMEGRWKITINGVYFGHHSRDGAEHEVSYTATHLSKGGVVTTDRINSACPRCIDPERMCPSMLRCAAEFVRQADESDIRKMTWLRSLLGGAGSPWMWASLIDPENPAPLVREWTERFVEGSERPPNLKIVDFRGEGWRIYARNVSPLYCVRRTEKYLGVSLQVDGELPPAPERMRVERPRSDEEFLHTLADYLGARLTKKADGYHLEPLPERRVPAGEPLAEAWRQSGSRVILEAPVVSDGKVVVELGLSGLTALDLQTGRRLWETRTDSCSAPPAVHEGVAYCGGGGDGAGMFAVRLSDGRKLWKHTEPHPRRGGMMIPVVTVNPLGVVDGAAIFTTSEQRIYALDTSTGSKRWQLDLPVFIHQTDVCSRRAGRMLYVASGRRACAIDLVREALEWQKTFISLDPELKGLDRLYAPMARARPVLRGGRLFTAGHGHVWALSVRDGHVVWHTDTGRYGGMDAPLEVVGGRLIVPGQFDDNHLYALDTDTGEILWSLNMQGCPQEVVRYGKDRMLVTAGRYMYLVDARNGRPIERRAFDLPLTTRPVPAGDFILVAFYDRSRGPRHGQGILAACRLPESWSRD